ncbi:hypothetical protein SDC9_160685 [bioreactor metagenome]|uniref:Uncharacterized protein n=1 Tax=bioreactor metagenome TaxID=1076179 RepID=A0A645FLS9_9ZZZZ
MGTIIRTRFGADGKARRYRETNAGHLGKVCTLSTEKLFHLSCSLCLAGAKEIDILVFLLCHNRLLILTLYLTCKSYLLAGQLSIKSNGKTPIFCFPTSY